VSPASTPPPTHQGEKFAPPIAILITNRGSLIPIPDWRVAKVPREARRDYVSPAATMEGGNGAVSAGRGEFIFPVTMIRDDGEEFEV